MKLKKGEYGVLISYPRPIVFGHLSLPFNKGHVVTAPYHHIDLVNKKCQKLNAGFIAMRLFRWNARPVYCDGNYGLRSAIFFDGSVPEEFKKG